MGNSSGIHILLIGEALVTCDGLKLAMEAAGYQLEIACSGAEGFAQATAQNFDVILLDCALDDISAADLARKFFSTKTTLPVLMVADPTFLRGNNHKAITPPDTGGEYGISSYVIRDKADDYLALIPVLIEDLIARSKHQRLLSDSHKKSHQALRDERTKLKSKVKERTVNLRREVVGRRESDVKLEKQSKLLELTLNSIDQGFVVWNADNELIICNDQFWEIFGIPKGLMGPGTHLLDVLNFIAKTGNYGEGNPDELAQKRYLEITDDNCLTETQYFSQTKRIYQVRRDPIENLGRITTFTDITDSVEGERTAQVLREALETFSDGLILYDRDEKVVFTNNRYHEIYPQSPSRDEIIGYSFTEILRRLTDAGLIDHPLARSDPESWIAMRSEERQKEYETHGNTIHTTGKRYHYKVCKTTDGGYIHLQHDITEQKLTEEALQRSEERLRIQVEELIERETRLEAQAADLVSLTDSLTATRDELKKINDQKDKFFTIIAHDLKGPFNSLLGYSSLLSELVGNGRGNRENNLNEDKVARYSDAVHQSAIQAFRLLENLLEWSRLQMGKLACDLGPVDVKEVITSNLQLYQPLADEKKIVLTSNVGIRTSGLASKSPENWKTRKNLENLDQPFLVLTDFDMLDTIIRNLLNNAIKFTPEKGSVTLSVRHSEQGIEIEVKDTGVGISPEKAARLFELDESSSTPGTCGEIGTGLGLQLCKELIEKINGKITVESREGIGTRFCITLPPLKNNNYPH